MGKLIRWLLILLVAGLVVSQITIHTSLYARKDNSVEIAFPQWKAEDPWDVSLLDTGLLQHRSALA